jgi:hypothetical protein
LAASWIAPQGIAPKPASTRMTTAYAILRMRGVPLGKRDYEGRLHTTPTQDSMTGLASASAPSSQACHR